MRLPQPNSDFAMTDRGITHVAMFETCPTCHQNCVQIDRWTSDEIRAFLMDVVYPGTHYSVRRSMDARTFADGNMERFDKGVSFFCNECWNVWSIEFKLYKSIMASRN
jgi:hypothetical protein